MKKLLSIFVVILIFAIYSCSHKSSKNEIKLSSNGKYVVLIFDSTTCPYCIKLHNDLKTNPKLKQFKNKMTIITIHVDKNNLYFLPTKKGNLKLDTEDLAQMFGFRGSTPFLVFCTSNFKPIVTIPGYLKPQTLSKVFEYVLSRAYQTMSIGQYLSTP